MCKPVLVAPAYFILLLLLFCGFDVYSLSVAGFFPLVVFVSGFLFCYLLVLPCLFLPYFIRKIYKMFLLAMGVICFAINFGLFYLYQNTFNFLDEDMIAPIMATNQAEASEYLSTYVNAEIVLSLLALIALMFLVFYALNRVSLKIRFLPRILLFVFLLFSCIVTVGRYKQISDYKVFWLLKSNRVPDLREYRQSPAILADDNATDNIVVILGESFSKLHSSLYGYEKSTNPKLAAMQAYSLLKVYPNVSSYATATIRSVKSIMAGYIDECADSINWYECLTLIEIMEKAGYKTHWISNQSKRGVYDNEVGRYAELCDAEYFVGDMYAGMSRENLDEELLPLIDGAISSNSGKNFYIIQMMGSHLKFSLRYPVKFSKFSADDYVTTHSHLSASNRQLVAEYDNSVLYNDSVVYEIMQRFADKDAAVFYFSDHSIDVFDSSDDYVGHAKREDEKSMFYGKQIPFMVYTTARFKASFPELEERMKQAVDVHYRTDSVMYTIMHVAGVGTVNGVSYKEKSLFKHR